MFPTAKWVPLRPWPVDLQSLMSPCRWPMAGEKGAVPRRGHRQRAAARTSGWQWHHLTLRSFSHIYDNHTVESCTPRDAGDPLYPPW